VTVLIIFYINVAILVYFAALSVWYLFNLINAFPEIIKAYQLAKYARVSQLIQHCTVPISVIIPTLNEARRVLHCVYSILQSDYTNTQIIIVNDGSTDNTLEILKDTFSLYEIPPAFNQAIRTSTVQHYYHSKLHDNLMVIDKAHGKAKNAADANNAGLNAVTTPLVMTLDADTILSPDALTNILFDFLSQKNCICVGGTLYLLNENQVSHGKVLTKSIPRNLIAAFQFLEYLRSFTYGRAGLNTLSGSLSYSGAFTLFETMALRKFGGFNKDNYAYDSEVVMNFHRRIQELDYPTVLHFSSIATAWTLVPDTLTSYWRQRNRWQRGTLLSIFNHIKMLFNPKYGIEGLITFPCYLFFEALGPVVEFVSYVLLLICMVFDLVSWTTVGWFILLAWSYLTLLTIGTLYLNLLTTNLFHRSFTIFHSILLNTIEMFGFRQFRAFCCFYSTCQFLINRMRGKEL
jgi:biofilm PGA synthesis N-glycosyltransferase PgaC